MGVEEPKKSKKKKKDKSETMDDDVEMDEDDGSKKKSKKERKKDKLISLEEENASEETSEKENTEKKSKKNNKRKRDDTMDVDEDESDLKKTKFDWDDVITGLLKNKDGNEMKLNKLKKKCVNEFFPLNEGTHKTAEEVGAKFDKKLQKRKYRLLKDKVRLILEDDDEQ